MIILCYYHRSNNQHLQTPQHQTDKLTLMRCVIPETLTALLQIVSEAAVLCILASLTVTLVTVSCV